LHEIFFEDAIEQAAKLDQHLEETGEFVGPMHGVPVSLKDQFHVKYAETTMGYVGWVGTFEGAKGTGREFHDESQLVQELHSVGAVLYCKVGSQICFYLYTHAKLAQDKLPTNSSRG
jgi:amidase